MSKIANPDSMVVVTTCDDAYAMACAVMLTSLFRNLQTEVPVSIEMIDAGTSVATQDKIAAIVERHSSRARLNWHRPDLRQFDALKLPELAKRTMIPRLILTELLPVHYEQAIYLDSDLIVEVDLQRLWRQEIGDRRVLAVRDFGHPSVSSGLRDTYKACGLDGDLPYFNSGVMVVNLRRWRLDGTSLRAVEYMQRFAELCRYPDQDPLNAAMAGNVGLLDPRWNAQVAAIQTHTGWPDSSFKKEIEPLLDDLLRAPYIRHFVGPTKPWNLGHRVHGRRRFFHYLQRSGWFEPHEWTWWVSQWAVRSMWVMAQVYFSLAAKTHKRRKRELVPDDVSSS